MPLTVWEVNVIAANFNQCAMHRRRLAKENRFNMPPDVLEEGAKQAAAVESFQRDILRKLRREETGPTEAREVYEHF